MSDAFTRIEVWLVVLAAVVAYPYAMVFAAIYERWASTRILSVRRLAFSLVPGLGCYLAASLLAVETGYDVTWPGAILTVGLLGFGILLPAVIVRRIVSTERGPLPFSHAFAACFFVAIMMQIGSKVFKGIAGGG